MFKYIRDTIQPDVMIWTGDNSNHAIWNISDTDVFMSTVNITNVIS